MKYKIPVRWAICDDLIIEANSLEEAISQAEDAELTEGEYIDSSFEVDHDLLADGNGNDYGEIKS